LASLGLRCLLVVDEEAERRPKERLPPRNPSYVRGVPSIVLTVRFFKRIGRLGAQARLGLANRGRRLDAAERQADRTKMRDEGRL